MSTAAVPFPEILPAGYERFADEPVFNPAVHLALENPDKIRHLQEFGYSEQEIASKATSVI